MSSDADLKGAIVTGQGAPFELSKWAIVALQRISDVWADQRIRMEKRGCDSATPRPPCPLMYRLSRDYAHVAHTLSTWLVWRLMGRSSGACFSDGIFILLCLLNTMHICRYFETRWMLVSGSNKRSFLKGYNQRSSSILNTVEEYCNNSLTKPYCVHHYRIKRAAADFGFFVAQQPAQVDCLLALYFASTRALLASSFLVFHFLVIQSCHTNPSFLAFHSRPALWAQKAGPGWGD